MCYPESTNPYNTHNSPEFDTFNIRTVFNGTETISFRGPRTWSLVPNEIKSSTSLPEFKNKTKYWKYWGACVVCVKFIYKMWALFKFI